MTIEMWYSDEYGNTGWMNVALVSGTATTACKSYWPAWYRHSVTKEQIYLRAGLAAVSDGRRRSSVSVATVT